MDVTQKSELWIKRLNIDGPQVFYTKVYEELFEMGQALTHYNLDKVSIEEVAEELADVLMQIEKICAVNNHFHLADRVTRHMKRKYLELQAMTYGRGH